MKLLKELREVLKQRGQFRASRYESAEPDELLKDIAVFIDQKYHKWVDTQDAGSPDDPIDHNGGTPTDNPADYPEEPQEPQSSEGQEVQEGTEDSEGYEGNPYPPVS